MTPDLEAIRARLESAKEHFLDSVEHDLTANPPRTITEAVMIARFYPSVFEDIDALLVHARNLNSIIGDYIQSTQIQAKKIDDLEAEVDRLRHSAEECECEHDARDVRTKQCAYILAANTPPTA